MVCKIDIIYLMIPEACLCNDVAVPLIFNFFLSLNSVVFMKKACCDI